MAERTFESNPSPLFRAGRVGVGAGMVRGGGAVCGPCYKPVRRESERVI